MDRIDIIKLVKNISGRWYIHSVLMIIGGLSGLLFSHLNPPVYETFASFSVTIDYTQTGALTDIQEDQAMRGVGSVILSDEVVSQTLGQLESEFNLKINQPEFLANSFLDREEFRWSLRYRDANPNNAEVVTKTWAKTANTIIQDALTHSLVSSALLDNLNEMKTCLHESSCDSGKGYCGFKDLETLTSAISELSGRIQIEKVSSLGLFSALSVSLVNEGQIYPSLVSGQRNQLVMSGALAGLILSIIAAAVIVMKRSSSI